MSKTLVFRYKVWLELNGLPVIGPGGIEILKVIDREGSLKGAARSLGMSYNFVWNYVRRLENILGIKVIETWRGGARHGGASLTNKARKLVELYESLTGEVERLAKVYEEQVSRLVTPGVPRGGEGGLQDSRCGKE